MNRVSRVIAASLVAVPLLAGSAFAAPAKTAKAKSPSAKSQSLVGTLQKFDNQTLTVQTSKGTETVTLAPNVQVRHGSKTMAASDLGSQTGSRIKVRYNEANGQKQARSITVSSAATVAHADTSSSKSKASKQ